MIIVAAGSRHATQAAHEPAIRRTLTWAMTGTANGHVDLNHELWQGLASGVDTIARTVGVTFGWTIRDFPATWIDCDPDWKDPLGKVTRCRPSHRQCRTNGYTRCPTAGFRRNQDMFDALSLRAGVRRICVAFPIPALGSRGTMDCLERALFAGVPVISVPLRPPLPARPKT